jgi:hypothetical protein
VTDILGPETLWPYVGLIGASGGARQSSVARRDPQLVSKLLAARERRDLRRTGRGKRNRRPWSEPD